MRDDFPRSRALPASLRLSPYVDGKWISGTGGTFEVLDPSTGLALATVEAASPADAIAAVDAAAAAQQAWAATAPRQRSIVLRRAWELLQERSETFAELITLEMGKPIVESRGEVAYGSEFLRWFSEEAVRIQGRFGRNPSGTGTIVVTKSPVGPAYLVTPWNFPLAMATRKIAPALAAGCTVILKPAEATPLTTLLLVNTLEDAGVPAGVLNVLPTMNARAVSEVLLGDRRVRKLSFTGSTRVGRALIAQAAPNVLRTSMELGGNAPFIVFEDADIAAAVDGAMLAKFRNTGQACTAANRFIVHEAIADEFAARLVERVKQLQVGPGTAAGTTIGPVIDTATVARLEELVEDALARGSRMLHRGDIPASAEGSYFAPIVLAEVPVDARVFDEEIFGPIVAMTTFASEDEAVRLANSTDYGLVGYVYTRNLSRAQRLIEAVESGMLGVNTGIVSDPAAPFGGVKQSGLGREGASEGIDEYLETRYALLT